MKNTQFLKAKEHHFDIITIPDSRYILIEGIGSPNDSNYQNSYKAIKDIAATFKSYFKPLKIEYQILPVECLWYHNQLELYTEDDKQSWKWTLMMNVPSFITDEILKTAVMETKRKTDNQKVELCRLGILKEGKCIQTLHLGPYSNKKETLEELYMFMKNHSFGNNGIYHEIYTEEKKSKQDRKYTFIIRQPVTSIIE